MRLGDIGQIALVVAFALAAYGLVSAALGGVHRRPEMVASARGAGYGVALLVSVASLVLLAALLTKDFTLRYVYENTSRDAPLDVTLSGFWGGQAGSLLFWAWALALLGAVVLAVEFRSYRALMPGFLGTLFAIQIFFLAVLAFVSSPFQQHPAALPDGRGLNPLLWDDGMRIHPPLLLAGYMSFSVPFAFAMAALLSGRLRREWLQPVRRWMLVAWGIQGAGLLAGAWWAYHVLGWGGYWGWDPVENVALLPWLTATAFLHSVMAQERRGLFKVWNLGLVIASFALAIFGTFVVRSGVLASVHSFAQSTVGPVFFAFLGVTLVAALCLLFYRLPQLPPEGHLDSVASREASFLLNNFLLLSIAAATFWGTIFPLVSELTRGAKVTVGGPFYQQVNGPLALGLLVLMGLGPLLAWRRTSLMALWRNVRWPLAAGLLVGIVLFALGVQRGLAALAFAAAAFTLGSIGLEFWRGVRARRAMTGEPRPVALWHLVARARRRYGGYLVHLSMVLIAFGVIGSSFYQTEHVVTFRKGETHSVGRYTFTYQGMAEHVEPGVVAIVAPLSAADGATALGTLAPERRIHRNWEQQPVSGVAYQTTLPWLEDIYVILSGWGDDGSATFRIYINPLVSLIWLGGAVFLLGTLIAAWPAAARPRASVLRPAPQEVLVAEA
ncbi:MAG: heme lyase CcmF/NrfE family subunit [Chloroflexi bacterium]|nr:heme lyase CcmF/NrfE family subunit [Chloroflexota bacterium]